MVSHLLVADLKAPVPTTVGIIPAPRRKRDDAVAHLLRHLHDASALRANPIAAPYFVPPDGSEATTAVDRAHALRRIQDAVAAAADKLLESGKGNKRAAIHAQRQHAIVRRCDLARESHAAVAADLGISRREFYRERKRASARLAEHLEYRSHHPVTALSEFDLQLDIVSSFCAAGKYESAVDMMEALTRTNDVARRIRAYTGSVSLLSELGRVDQANASLRAARELYRAGGISANEETLARAEIEIAAATVAWSSGDLRAAAAGYESVRWLLSSSYRSSNARAGELRATALIELGKLKREIGDIRGSLQLLGLAARTIDSIARPSPFLRAEFLSNLSLTYVLSPMDLEKSAACISEYLAYTREHNLLCQTAGALATLVALHLQWGEPEAAARFARSSVKLASSVCSELEFVFIAIGAVIAEATVNPRNALDLVAQVRNRTVPGEFANAMLEVASAEALLAAGAYESARATAAGAARLMTDLGAARYVGSALRIAAEAEESLGNSASAIVFIREALRALESSGHTSSLAKAFACSARLTENVTHAANARDLLETLRRPHTPIVT